MLGKRVKVYPTATGELPHPGERFRTYDSLAGQEATIERELGDDERDLEEVGRMFTVRFEDGTLLDTFEDELEVGAHGA